MSVKVWQSLMSFQYEGLIDEIRWRIGRLEEYLVSLRWWHFREKWECGRYLEKCYSHLRALEEYRTRNERVLDRQFIDQVWSDILASSASLNT